jgi:hypothetical protein
LPCVFGKGQYGFGRIFKAIVMHGVPDLPLAMRGRG